MASRDIEGGELRGLAIYWMCVGWRWKQGKE